MFVWKANRWCLKSHYFSACFSGFRSSFVNLSFLFWLFVFWLVFFWLLIYFLLLFNKSSYYVLAVASCCFLVSSDSLFLFVFNCVTVSWPLTLPICFLFCCLLLEKKTCFYPTKVSNDTPYNLQQQLVLAFHIIMWRALRPGASPSSSWVHHTPGDGQQVGTTRRRDNETKTKEWHLEFYIVAEPTSITTWQLGNEISSASGSIRHRGSNIRIRNDWPTTSDSGTTSWVRYSWATTSESRMF